MECLHLISSYSKADLQARKDLAEHLKLQNLPGDGYLLINKIHNDIHGTPYAPPAMSASAATINKLKTHFNHNLAVVRSKLGLYAPSLDHRESQLELSEYT